MNAIFAKKRELTSELTINDYTLFHGMTTHFHSTIEILIVTDGKIEVLVNNTHATLGRGDIAISMSYESHRYNTQGHSNATILFIPVGLCEDFISATKKMQSSNPIIRSGEAYSKIMECVECLRRENTNRIEKTGYINVILGTLLRYLELTPTEKNADISLTSRLLVYINENYTQSITPESLAQKFGYSKEYISEIFRAAFNIGIRKYLNSVRLKNALLLMLDGNMNFTDCALDAGFSSIRTFYRSFYAEFGCTPKKYLALIKQQ